MNINDYKDVNGNVEVSETLVSDLIGEINTNETAFADVMGDLNTHKAKFAGSFASIGWRKLPDGTIEQWGYVFKDGLTPNAWNSFVISFPVAFTNNVWHVAPTIYPQDGSSGTYGVTSYGNGTKTQFTAYAKPDSSGNFYYMWRAFGL